MTGADGVGTPRRASRWRRRRGGSDACVSVDGWNGADWTAVAIKMAEEGDGVLFTDGTSSAGRESWRSCGSARSRRGPRVPAADLPLLADTARLADDVARRTDRLDAVVFCAGILSTNPKSTEQGFERNLVLNYLSRYLLARRFLPRLPRRLRRLVLVPMPGCTRTR